MGARAQGMLRGCSTRLAEADDVPSSALLLDDPVYTRLNEHYRPALELATLLLCGQSFAETRGGLAAQSFIMHR